MTGNALMHARVSKFEGGEPDAIRQMVEALAAMDPARPGR
jgi:hypothetical protein